MANDVFANGNEISCKAAEGTSKCEFPDVCFTPPQTPATPPGVPVPYPNTGLASDTTNGSRSVKISGKEVMLRNKSYFKKSMGDEAGCAPKKGIITSTNRGKIYFISWSMNVRIEGANVVRHRDLTTHNHASQIGTGSTPTGHADSAAEGKSDEDKCNHEYDCKPILNKHNKGKTIDEAIDDKKAGKNAGDDFEARALVHNRNQIKSSDEISPYFKCKKEGCTLQREVDHITTDNNGNITKIVQCKSDQSKLDPTKKGVIVPPKQLKESRKLAAAVNECQKNTGVTCELEYKLEDTESGKKAKEFLEKKDPPRITMVK
jgi:hypothetical protein